MKLIYEKGIAHTTVFIKLNKKDGIRFGELRHQLTTGNEEPGDPEWISAGPNDVVNKLSWTKVEDGSKPVNDKYVKMHDLLNVAIKSISKKQLISLTFEGPNG